MSQINACRNKVVHKNILWHIYCIIVVFVAIVYSKLIIYLRRKRRKQVAWKSFTLLCLLAFWNYKLWWGSPGNMLWHYVLSENCLLIYGSVLCCWKIEGNFCTCDIEKNFYDSYKFNRAKCNFNLLLFVMKMRWRSSCQHF